MMTKIHEMFLCVLSDYTFRNMDMYLIMKEIEALPEYSIEKAIDIYFEEIRHIMTWRNWEGRKIDFCINPTPKEARELSIMLEEYYRWEIVD